MVWTGCRRIFLRCQLSHLSRTAACAGSEVPPPVPGCAAGPGCDGRPDPSASRRPSASCAGCRCKRQGLGRPPCPPLLSNHPYRAGLEGLIIARRRRPFFSSASVPYACPFPFHSFLYCCLFCPSIRVWGQNHENTRCHCCCIEKNPAGAYRRTGRQRAYAVADAYTNCYSKVVGCLESGLEVSPTIYAVPSAYLGFLLSTHQFPAKMRLFLPSIFLYCAHCVDSLTLQHLSGYIYAANVLYPTSFDTDCTSSPSSKQR